jgi:hypothetical protein
MFACEAYDVSLVPAILACDGNCMLLSKSAMLNFGLRECSRETGEEDLQVFA